MKIERLRSRALPFKHPLSIEDPTRDDGVSLSSMKTGQTIVQPPAKASTSPPTTKLAVAKSKDNPYTKLEVGKCYRCDESRHRSNECPKKRPVNVADHEEKNDVLTEIELEDYDFTEEHGDRVAYVIQKVFCSQMIPDTKQRHQIFYSRCLVKDKICNLIIDNGSCESIFSRTLVDHLKLETKWHYHSYDIGWIK